MDPFRPRSIPSIIIIIIIVLLLLLFLFFLGERFRCLKRDVCSLSRGACNRL